MVKQDSTHWQASWEAHEDAELEAWMLATPAQRLAWLEDALLLAHKSGNLPLNKDD